MFFFVVESLHFFFFFFLQVVEREEDEEEQEVEEEEVKKGNQRESVGGLKDLEKGEMGGGFQEQETVQNYPPPTAGEMQMSRNQRLSATNPLRLVINSNTRVASPSIPHPSHQHQHLHPHRPSPSPSVPRSTPTPQVSLLNLCVKSRDWSSVSASQNVRTRTN